MNKKTRSGLILTIVLALLFIVFTVLVMKVDVQPIGPTNPETNEKSEVGFATLNGKVRSFLTIDNAPVDVTDDAVDMTTPLQPYYTASKLLELLSFAVIAFFALLGAKQLIAGRSLKKVDYRILALGALYIIVGILYIASGKITINFRPLLEADGTLEPSYPSSHTLMAVTVFGSAMFITPKLFGKAMAKCVNVLLGVIAAASVIARLLSGVHWLTDIIGALLLALALVSAYGTVLSYIHAKHKKQRKRKHRKQQTA